MNKKRQLQTTNMYLCSKWRLFGVAEQTGAAQSPRVGRDIGLQVDSRDKHEIGALGLLVDRTRVVEHCRGERGRSRRGDVGGRSYVRYRLATTDGEERRLFVSRHGRNVNYRHRVEKSLGPRLDLTKAEILVFSHLCGGLRDSFRGLTKSIL